MIQVEVPHYQELPSQTHINLRLITNTSWLLKEPMLVNTSIVELKPPLPSEMFYQSTQSQKVPSSITLKRELEIRELMPEPLEPQSPSLDTPKTEPRPESDYHLDPERLSQENVELPLVLLLVDKELINQS